MVASKRVLIIAYHFPPAPCAGALRPSHLARYLPEFGWEPVVLTKHFSPGVELPPYVETARDLFTGLMGRRPAPGTSDSAAQKPVPGNGVLRSARDAVKKIALFPDRAAGWLPAALARALEISRRRRLDAIISTSPPLTSHIIACLTALRRGLPWIADYRDLWFGNPYFGQDLTTRITYAIERWLLRHPAWITGVSDHIVAHQRLAFNKSGEAIPSAYDPDDWKGLDDIHPASFTLCYAGMLYDGKRRLDMVMSAVAALRRAGDPAGIAARFEIYGPDDHLVRQLSEKFGLGDVVKSSGPVERSKVLQAQRRAAVLLLPLSTDPATSQDVGSKIFEYIGARRPIIAVGPPDSAVRHIIDSQGLGWFVLDEDSCAQAIRAAYARFLGRNFEPASAHGQIATAHDVARRFAGLLDEVYARRHPMPASLRPRPTSRRAVS